MLNALNIDHRWGRSPTRKLGLYEIVNASTFNDRIQKVWFLKRLIASSTLSASNKRIGMMDKREPAAVPSACQVF